jgi:radical SAM superfamily enzyme YgiQ (UPF0313 family)
MNILLINPKSLRANDSVLESLFSRMTDTSGYIESLHSGISTGLLTIAAVTPDKYSIEFVDENHDNINYSSKYDLIAISAATQQATQSYEIAARFKKLGVKTAIGGIHATVMPDEALNYFDHVFMGEAEETWPEFLNDIDNNTTKRIYKNEYPLDLTKYPMPRYDLLKKENYTVLWVQASRGCPHDCEFCAATKVFGMKVRYKTVEQVLTELRFIKSIWGDIKIDFADDNLFTNKKFARELVDNLKGMNLKWYAQTDISIAVNEKFLEEIREAGCLTLFIGFESVSELALGQINKSKWKLKQLPKYKKSIEIIQSKGIGIVGAFIIGFDGDTIETLKETASFIIENKLFSAQIAILTPFPGTSLYTRFKDEGRLKDLPWKDYTGLQPTYEVKTMTNKELQQGLYQIYEQVYNAETRLNVMMHFKKIYKRLSNNSTVI